MGDNISELYPLSYPSSLPAIYLALSFYHYSYVGAAEMS